MSLEQTLLKLNQELQNKKVLVAVSGGVDSMVLLHAIKHFSPIVVHFNHHRREASIKDELLVTSFCKQENLTYVIKHLFIEKGNFQSEAHKLRQSIYLELAHQFHLTHVLTAHHQDDHIETIIMRILKGSSFEKLEGLKYINKIKDIIFYKPFLNIPKSALYSYAKDNHVQFLEDQSNLSTTYTRNKIRHSLIPKLEIMNPAFKSEILMFSKRVQENSFVFKLLAFPYVTKHLSRKKLISLDPYLSKEVIQLWLTNQHQNPSKNYVDRIYNELFNEKPNLEILLENEAKVLFVYDDIFIVKNFNPDLASPQIIENLSFLGNKRISIFYDNKPNIKLPLIKICYNKLILPLSVRYRQPGDILHFHYGHKKLKDHLINIKYPRHLRDSLVVLEDQTKTILYIEGVYINKTLGDAHTMWVMIETHDE